MLTLRRGLLRCIGPKTCRRLETERKRKGILNVELDMEIEVVIKRGSRWRFGPLIG
jgi:hypothetical protein